MRTFVVGASWALLVAAATPARAEMRLDGGQAHAGFAAEVHIATQLLALGGGQQTTAFGSVQGGIFAGYKLGRFIFGLGFDIARTASGASAPGANDTSQARTAILFSPGVRVAIVRSADQRVELFGEFDIGFGHTFDEQSPSPQGTQPSTSNFHLTYVVG